MNHWSSFRTIRLVGTFLIALLSFSSIQAQDGEALFKANCASCHAVKEKLVGPALKGIETRRPEDWLIKWIKNSQTLVKAGDDYAVKIYNDYNKVAMPAFNLKDDEIKAMLAYIKTEAEKPDAVAGPKGPAGGAAQEAPKPIGLYLIIAIVIIGAIAMVLRRVQDTLARTVRQKQGLPEPAPMTRSQAFVHWSRNNKKLVAVILIFLALYGSVKGWYALQSVGIHQGYLPEQPIKYSHQLHAGKLQIQCIYCHSGAEKGKVAGVPSANVCMNCHKYVRKGPETGTEEIAKIYKALDYDPDKGTYGPNPKPLQWVRVHNLPDLAYFNHAQHVKVGQVVCQTCHGPVQDSMTVASQYSPLTMGWCIDCHRKTPVKMAGNGYYAGYDHSKLIHDRNTPDSVITVAKIGGLECSRCHY